ncbi:hypothetical protein LV457_09955 [Mycobacterium sp. MYCO198283]|uniref:hypothetical protein n=1 Tax=Mycobacterium sp. MYCO198283 TaxID=2883505 RepID=UPI001E2871FA|nr:hypothetical protein [Mycobacterium sp. MYCO198283]MCG5432609.1 hypothetical protein [Mycobacterium sp. MYCO198283]
MAIDAAKASFDSTHSLYDYDLVMWDPHNSMQTYLQSGYGAGSHNGLPRISDHNSPRLRHDISRRKNDFEEFLKLGRTLVVFLPGDMRVYIDSGERTHSGTGRNRQTTTIVKPLNILDALPERPLRAATLGEAMEPAHSSIGPLYRQTADYWCYASVFDESEDLRPLLRVKGTSKLTAAHTDCEGGTIIFLPILLTGTWDEDNVDADYGEDDSDGEESRDHGGGAEPSEQLGLDRTIGDDDFDRDTIDKMVLDWLIAFTSAEKVVWPDWADKYRFQTEVDRASEITQRQAKIAQLQTELDLLNAEQDADRQWKLLIAGTGTPFEEAAAAALTHLGFDLKPTIPGRTDLRGSRGDASIVAETKGVTKSAAESHCAQLEKWVAEDLEAGQRSKGILIINAYINDPPLERTKPTFPDQMRRYAEMRNHCLVSGLQLLVLARTALAKPERVDQLANLLLDTTGVINGWDNLTEIFSDTPPPPVSPRR